MPQITLNTGAKLENRTEGIIADAVDISGGYFVTASTEITSTGAEGKIPDYACVEGAICYCTADSKFYQCHGEYNEGTEKWEWEWLEARNVGIQYFSDIRPIVNNIGSIKAGETFETPISVQTLLARILYPFTELALPGAATAKNSAGVTMVKDSPYTIPDYPTLDEITFTITPNSVTDFSFILYKSTDLVNGIAEATYNP